MPPKIPGFGAEPHSMLFNVLRRSLIILVLFHESVGFIPTDSAEYPEKRIAGKSDGQLLRRNDFRLWRSIGRNAFQ